MSNTSNPIVEALQTRLETDPENSVVWLHLATLLDDDDRLPEATDAMRKAVEFGEPDPQTAARLVHLLRVTNQLAEGLIRAEQLLSGAAHSGMHAELIRILRLRGDADGAARELAAFKKLYPNEQTEDLEPESGSTSRSTPGAATSAPVSTPSETSPNATGHTVEPASDENETPPPAENLLEVRGADNETDEDWASQFDWGDLHVTFNDVAGLDDVKRQIRLRIIAPMKNQGIYDAFQRKSGGGILLYGPPGCGKTHLARATAGESGAQFVAIGIHEIIDKYWGESEKLIHALFAEARRKAPTILFFDEFDALASPRGSGSSQFWKTMVDQLLQEMDGLQANNDGVLVFAATNVPWNVDSAFRRPGRFDRMFFVPPPDRKGRAAILQMHGSKLPGGANIPFEKLAKDTVLFTGADLKSLCERASEDALERSIESGSIQPVAMADFQRELAAMDSSAQEWLATARNYARYGNEGGQYDQLKSFLKKAKRW